MSGLAGRTVVVTRAPEQAGALSEALGAHGARVLELPTIQILPPERWEDLDRALASPERYTALILGSKNAAEAVRARLAARGGGPELSLPLACVGEKTLAAAEGLSRGDRLAPPVHRAEALLELLLQRFGAGGRRFLFPRAAEGRELLLEGLAAAGAQVDAPIAYRIATAPPPPPEQVRALAAADAFTFLSGETLARFLQLLGETEARALLARAVVAVIGPVARERAQALGVRVDVVPKRATVEALVEALAARL